MAAGRRRLTRAEKYKSERAEACLARPVCHMGLCTAGVGLGRMGRAIKKKEEWAGFVWPTGRKTVVWKRAQNRWPRWIWKSGKRTLKIIDFLWRQHHVFVFFYILSSQRSELHVLDLRIGRRAPSPARSLFKLGPCLIRSSPARCLYFSRKANGHQASKPLLKSFETQNRPHDRFKVQARFQVLAS